MQIEQKITWHLSAQEEDTIKRALMFAAQQGDPSCAKMLADMQGVPVAIPPRTPAFASMITQERPAGAGPMTPEARARCEAEARRMGTWTEGVAQLANHEGADGDE